MQIVKLLADRSTNRIPLGKQGENQATAIEFCCKTWLEMWPNATIALAVQPPQGDAYPAVIQRDGDIARWVITAADTAYPGTGKCELRVLDGEVVKKSITFMTYITESFTADGEAPDPVTDWIEDAQAKLGEVDDALDDMADALAAIPQTIDTALQEAKESGEFDGADGISPSITITDITGGHRIIITDANGTHTVDILDGAKGDTGRGIVSVQKTGTAGLVDTYTITYTDSTTSTFTVMNGQNGNPGADGTTFTPSVSAEGVISWTNDGGKTNPQPVNIKGPRGKDYVLTAADKAEIAQQAAEEVNVPVQDVQVNGVSALDAQGVAKVPVASSNVLGVAKFDPIYGVNITPAGQTYISGADSSMIKNPIGGYVGYRPIVAGKQHESTFYGLAAAAADTSQSASSNPVGTYTESAKSAISQMLDAPETVSGTTPSITAKAGVRYICGECATLTIVAPASGCIDVTFTSGSTATVLTVSSAKTGVSAIKWANGFDPTSLEVNTVYEINILDGEFGVVGSWT